MRRGRATGKPSATRGRALPCRFARPGREPRIVRPRSLASARVPPGRAKQGIIYRRPSPRDGAPPHRSGRRDQARREGGERDRMWRRSGSDAVEIDNRRETAARNAGDDDAGPVRYRRKSAASRARSRAKVSSAFSASPTRSAARSPMATRRTKSCRWARARGKTRAIAYLGRWRAEGVGAAHLIRLRTDLASTEAGEQRGVRRPAPIASPWPVSQNKPTSTCASATPFP
jgi:hypothetical protein